MASGDLKHCARCDGNKPHSDFNRNASRKDGLSAYCRECLKGYDKKWRDEHREEESKRRHDAYIKRRDAVAEYHREYERRPYVRLARAAKARRQDKLLRPLAAKARYKVRSAIRSGKLIRSGCEKCGGVPAHAHHADYNRPLEVQWLCPLHHRQEHERLATKTEIKT